MPNIIEITDFHAPELDPYARLTQNQLRNRLEPEKGIFIAESPKVISRALDAGYPPLSLLMERKVRSCRALLLIAIVSPPLGRCHGRDCVLNAFDCDVHIPLILQLDPRTVTRLHHSVRAVSDEGFVGGDFVRGERFFDGGGELIYNIYVKS